jgi:hypothetical protein
MLTMSEVALGLGRKSAKEMAGLLGFAPPVSLKALLKEFAYGPRPFYVIGHNPNTISMVLDALNSGANAIEPDVNLNLSTNPPSLCISHDPIPDPPIPAFAPSSSLEQYLTDLHNLSALTYPGLVLVVFDCKPPIATPEYGLQLLEAIRAHLTSGTDINVILSVAKLKDAAMFDKIRHMLRPREGLMIDEENDPEQVAAFFAGAGVENRCYGNGSTFQSPTTSPNLRPSIEHACGIRAGNNSFKFIYEWTNDDDERMREFMLTGVDGIITDDAAKLRAICVEDQLRSQIRLASRAHNPFRQPNANYGLAVQTGAAEGSGNVTFTLTGSRGSIAKVVDASLEGRMEANEWTFITLHSPDLGNLVSATVQCDEPAGWDLNRIEVRSFRYGVSKQAIFNSSINRCHR